jgi:hypothetical protein
MAGDDDLVWSFGTRTADRADECVVVLDPRDPGDQDAIFTALDDALAPMWAFCVQNELWPQITVPTRSAVRLLELASIRILRDSTCPEARRAAHRLLWLTSRHPVPGQQSVIVAVDALLDQVVTGLPAHDDQHLGAVLAWIRDPRMNLRQRTAVAAKASADAVGVLANPEVDRLIEPHVNGTGDRLARLDAVREPLERELVRRLGLLDEAMDLVADMSGAITPPVERIVIRASRSTSCSSSTSGGRGSGTSEETQTAVSHDRVGVCVLTPPRQ